MDFRFAARRAAAARRTEGISGIRPVTLLIATGIALITAVLMVTGIAANHLRQQALVTAGSELVRIDGVLAVASNQVLSAVDSQLAEIADRIEQTGNTRSLS